MTRRPKALFAALLAFTMAVPVVMGATFTPPTPQEDVIAILWQDFCERKPEHVKCVPDPTPTPEPTPTPTPEPTPEPTPTPTPEPTVAYGGTPVSLPGTIEAEEYDTDGAGNAFSDTTPTNEGGQFRTDAVDIKGTSGVAGDYTVGWMKSGEWLDYEVDVAVAGTYDLSIVYGAETAGGTFRIEVDGTDVTGPKTLADAGGWDDQQVMDLGDITLAAGRQTVRFVATGNSSNSFMGDLNRIIVEEQGAEPTPTPTPEPTPEPTPTPTPTPVPTPSCPSSLSAGINATATGGTLNVTGCNFTGDTTISKAITILGGKVTGGEVYVRANDVTLDGLELTGGQAALQQGNIDVENVSRTTLRDVYVHDSMGSCISLQNGSDHRVEDSELARCQQQGFHATLTTDAVFVGNHIHDNNTSAAPGPRIEAGWEAGGGKMTVSTGAVFDGNESNNNGGPGLWCDVDCLDIEYVNNRVHHNSQGIFYEISDGADIHHNVVWNNGAGEPWCYGAGILVSSSKNNSVHDNVAAWNNRGITFLSQDRGSSDWNDTSGNHAANNTVIDQDGLKLMNWCASPGFTNNLFTSGNSGTGGKYWAAQAEPQWERFEWQSPKSTLSEFNATPGDEGGTYLTNAQKDAVLAANDLPAQP